MQSVSTVTRRNTASTRNPKKGWTRWREEQVTEVFLAEKSLLSWVAADECCPMNVSPMAANWWFVPFGQRSILNVNNI